MNDICKVCVVQRSRSIKYYGIHGVMVACLTLDQKVACSIYVGFSIILFDIFNLIIIDDEG